MARKFQSQHVGRNFVVTDTQSHQFKMGELLTLETVICHTEALFRNKKGGMYGEGFVQLLSPMQVSPK